MIPRHILRAARGCDAVSQIFQVKLKNLGKNQNFDTPTTFMSLQDEEKFPLLDNDQNTMTPLLRALQGIPLDGPLQNHLQQFFVQKLLENKRQGPRIDFAQRMHARENACRPFSFTSIFLRVLRISLREKIENAHPLSPDPW